MIKQRGQSAVEFALMAPLVMFMILAAIYGGAMFIQFMNYSNEARRIAREIAVTDPSKRAALVKDEYNGVAANSQGKTLIGIYKVNLETFFIAEDGKNIKFFDDDGKNIDVSGEDLSKAKEVQVIFKFTLPEGRKFFFDFPPSSFEASYHMQLEN